jgi:RNA polymerase sigma-70 factor (ECF subfamily)
MFPATSYSLLNHLIEPVDPPARQAAWGRFVRLYSPVLLAWARKRGMQDALAADFAQEVFLRLATKLASYRPAEARPFRAWLFTLVRHLYRDFRAARCNRPLPGVDGLSRVGDGAEPDGAAEMDEREYRLRLTRRAMEVIRERFQPATWEAFRLLAVEGLPVAEVTARLGITADAAHAARSRVLAGLREELAEFLE